MSPKYIDSHTHTNFKIFDNDRDEVIERALSNDTWLINVGTQYDTSKKAVELSNMYSEGVYAIIGLHPIHTSASHHDEEELGQGNKEFTSREEIFDENKYKELAKQGKVVGIGECGLDYYHIDEDGLERQKQAFIAQIKLASDLDLPLMLHIRNNPKDKTKNAYFDVYELIKKHSSQYIKHGKVKGVSHFFAGSIDDMKRFVDIGIHISFAGPITYKPNKEICDYEEVIKATPIEMILTDTDSPYVAPVPYRGERNEPFYVQEISRKIAQIKGLDEAETANQIVLNTKNLFNI